LTAATQVVEVSGGIRDERDVAYVADILAGDAGRPVQVLAWSKFDAEGEI
jgi:phosphoribosylformimino-5-aminoimidazole carboxamide ribonucleotide (ProFAR) isomerase